MKFAVAIALVIASLASAEIPNSSPTFARQTSYPEESPPPPPSAPYPPSGWRPSGEPFTLPKSQQQQTPPVKPPQTYGAPKPPQQMYGPPKPPQQMYGPPKPPQQMYGPPKPPQQMYGPPKPPQQMYGPPPSPPPSYGPPPTPTPSYGPPAEEPVATESPDGTEIEPPEVNARLTSAAKTQLAPPQGTHLVVFPQSQSVMYSVQKRGQLLALPLMGAPVNPVPIVAAPISSKSTSSFSNPYGNSYVQVIN